MIEKELNKIMILKKDNIPQIENILNGITHDILIDNCYTEAQDTNKKWIKNYSNKINIFQTEYMKRTFRFIYKFPDKKVLSFIYAQINEDLPYKIKISDIIIFIEAITQTPCNNVLRTISKVTYLRDKFDSIFNKLSYDEILAIVKDNISTKEITDELKQRLIADKLSHQTQDNSKQSINLADQNTQQPILS